MDDLISRQAAIEAINRAVTKEAARWSVKELPSAEVKPVKRGKWVNVNPTVDSVQCSNCGYQVQSTESTTPYCPWCGARMGKEE